MIVGGDDENGNFNSFLITFVFNLVGTGYSSKDNIIVVDRFDCKYKYYSFEFDPVVNARVKKLQWLLLCRIALKLE